jgi:hypothetical protein
MLCDFASLTQIRALAADVIASRPRLHISLRRPLAILAAALVAVTAGIWLFRSRGDPSVLAVPHLRNALQVSSALDVENYPTWSPDGREIAFFSDRDGNWGLYTVAAIGGIPRNILSLPGIGNLVLNWSAPQ